MAGPCTQIVPQWTSSGRVGRNASTSCRADSGREAEHVDHGVGAERGHPFAEHPVGVLGVAVHRTRSTPRHSGAGT